MKTSLENLPSELIAHILFLVYKHYTGFFDQTFFSLRRTSRLLKEKTDDCLSSHAFKGIHNMRVNALKALLIKTPYNCPAHFFGLNIMPYDAYARLYHLAIRGDANFWAIVNNESPLVQKNLHEEPIFHLTSSRSSYVVPLLPLLIYYGNLNLVLEYEKNLPKDVSYQKILAWDSYDAFYRACVCNYPRLVELLFEDCIRENRQKMLRGAKKHHYKVFVDTAREANFNILRLLIQFCEPKKYQALIKAEGCIAFSCACRNGDEKVIDLLWQICEPKYRFQMLSTSSHTPLRWAMKNGQVKTVKKLFFLYPEEMRQSVLEEICGSVRHVRSIEVLRFLVSQWSNPDAVPFYSRSFNEILRLCSNDEYLFDNLIAKTPAILLQEEIRYQNCDIFRYYCSRGKVTLIKKLFNIFDTAFVPKWLPQQSRQIAFIEAFGYTAFNDACNYDNYSGVEVLFELCAADKKQEMIASRNHDGFRTVCYHENLLLAALIFLHADVTNLKALEKIAKDPYPKKNWQNQPIKDKKVKIDVRFLFFYRYFMQSIEQGKKIIISKQAKEYMYKHGMFKNINIIDCTKSDPYHSWSLVKSNQKNKFWNR